jgi:hypothetical protein
MKKYSTWLKTAGILQFIAAFFQATAFFANEQPKNETEKQLFSLMDTYKFDFGAGIHRTMNNLVLVLSACFFLVCLLDGLMNWYLLKKKVDPNIMRGVININLVVFGILFALTARFAFWPPIILSGLILLFLVLSRLTITTAIKTKNSLVVA